MEDWQEIGLELKYMLFVFKEKFKRLNGGLAIRFSSFDDVQHLSELWLTG